jgi:phage/plasmid-associated DNA primase
MYFLSLIASRNTQFKAAGFFIGKTNTGKTTTISIMEAIYPDMIQGLPSSILVGKGDRHINGNQPNPFLAQLEGKGAGVANETERNTYLNTSLFKEITGGGSIITRDLFKTAHPFIPTAQIIMTTNDPPRFDSHDDATIGRMVIIPFMIQHNKEKENNIQPDEFIDKFRHEFPAIIRVFAEYYIRLKTKHNRLIPLSEECKRYKNNYVEDQDTDLDKFVKDCIQFTISEDKLYLEKVKDVYHRYLKYYGFVDEYGNPDEKNKDALTQNKFTRYLKKDYMTWGLNYKQKKINGYPELCFLNIRLAPYDGKTNESTPQNMKSKKPDEPVPPPDDDPFN